MASFRAPKSKKLPMRLRKMTHALEILGFDAVPYSLACRAPGGGPAKEHMDSVTAFSIKDYERPGSKKTRVAPPAIQLTLQFGNPWFVSLHAPPRGRES